MQSVRQIVQFFVCSTLNSPSFVNVFIGQKKMSKKRISQLEHQTSTFALSKIYNVNFSLFERLLIGSGQLTQSCSTIKKVGNRKGPSILDALYDRKKSKCSTLMGINKFVFVLEHKMGGSNVSYAKRPLCCAKVSLKYFNVDSRPSNSNHTLFWLFAITFSNKAMIPVTLLWWP